MKYASLYVILSYIIERNFETFVNTIYTEQYIPQKLNSPNFRQKENNFYMSLIVRIPISITFNFVSQDTAKIIP